MNESGLGLLAACLPTLYGFLNTHGLKRIADSFPAQARLSQKQTHDKSKPRADSMGSNIEMVVGAACATSVHSYDGKENYPSNSQIEPEDGQILVHKSFERVEHSL